MATDHHDNETPLHPRNLYYHTDNPYSWDQFSDNLTNAINKQLPSGRKPYSSVSALLITFIESEKVFRKESGSFAKFLSTTFNYDCHKLGIPSSWDELSFRSEFTNWLRANSKENGLIIIYYGGHAQSNKEEKCIWHSGSNSKTKIALNWSAIQDLLSIAKGDHLVILDCCFAGTAGISSNVEILASCDAIGKSPSPGVRSFTARVIKAMGDFGDKPFNVSMLYGRLLSREYRVAGGAQPIHVPLADSVKPPITLSKFNANPDVVSGIPSIPGQDEPKVIITLTLDAEARLPVMTEWVDYLTTHVPSFIERGEIRIEGVYRASSCVVKVMMPVAIWRCLIPHPALRFDCLVEGGNYFLELPITVRRRQVKRSNESERTLNEEEAAFENWIEDYGGNEGDPVAKGV